MTTTVAYVPDTAGHLIRLRKIEVKSEAYNGWSSTAITASTW